MGLTGDYHLVARTYDVVLPQLAPAYDGFRILQVSDVHNATREIAGGMASLVAAAYAASPQIIALTGDLVDRHDPDPDGACSLVAQLARIAPTYYVTGNHERTPLGTDGMPLSYRRVDSLARAGTVAQEGVADLFARYGDRFVSSGARVLEGRTVLVGPDGAESADAPLGDGSRDGRLVLCGVRDPWPLSVTRPGAWEGLLEDVAQRAREIAGPQGTTVLLAHRPERVGDYARVGIALALTGHAHGGQVRLPLIGALIAPNQGFFPRYNRGLYRVGATQLVVSSGVGTTGYRMRLLCPPEVVLVRLRCGSGATGVQNDRTQR